MEVSWPFYQIKTIFLEIYSKKHCKEEKMVHYTKVWHIQWAPNYKAGKERGEHLDI